MASKEDRGRALPKFGEWDVNNPASAEGYTVIFKRARDEKKKPVGASSKTTVTPRRSDEFSNDSDSPSRKKKWFCFGV